MKLSSALSTIIKANPVPDSFITNKKKIQSDEKDI
jgi:hypothetical protein